MNDRCDETESCTCNACVKARADFDAWADAFEARWAKRFTPATNVCEYCECDAECDPDPATAPSGLLERAL